MTSSKPYHLPKTAPSETLRVKISTYEFGGGGTWMFKHPVRSGVNSSIEETSHYTSNCAVAPEDRESSLVTCWRQLSDAQSWPSDVRLEMGCDDHSTLAGKKGNEGTMLSRAWDVFAFHSSL